MWWSSSEDSGREIILPSRSSVRSSVLCSGIISAIGSGNGTDMNSSRNMETGSESGQLSRRSSNDRFRKMDSGILLSGNSTTSPDPLFPSSQVDQGCRNGISGSTTWRVRSSGQRVWTSLGFSSSTITSQSSIISEPLWPSFSLGWSDISTSSRRNSSRPICVTSRMRSRPVSSEIGWKVRTKENNWKAIYARFPLYFAISKGKFSWNEKRNHLGKAEI